MKILYLLKDRNIIGHIKGHSNLSHLTSFEDYTYDVYIDYVFIDNDFRNKKLCKIMVQLFLLNANLSANNKISFLLLNSGGEISCKCYFDAFNECGYKIFAYQYDWEKEEMATTRTQIIRDNCANHEMYMSFIPNNVNGGKYKKNKKSKKNKKIKNPKKIKKTKKHNYQKLLNII
jgi:hypothetical protein